MIKIDGITFENNGVDISIGGRAFSEVVPSRTITRTDYAVFNTRDVMLKAFDTEEAATEYANNRAAIMGGLTVAKLVQTREDLTTHDSND